MLLKNLTPGDDDDDSVLAAPADGDDDDDNKDADGGAVPLEEKNAQAGDGTPSDEAGADPTMDEY